MEGGDAGEMLTATLPQMLKNRDESIRLHVLTRGACYSKEQTRRRRLAATGASEARDGDFFVRKERIHEKFRTGQSSSEYGQRSLNWHKPFWLEEHWEEKWERAGELTNQLLSVEVPGWEKNSAGPCAFGAVPSHATTAAGREIYFIFKFPLDGPRDQCPMRPCCASEFVGDLGQEVRRRHNTIGSEHRG